MLYNIIFLAYFIPNSLYLLISYAYFAPLPTGNHLFGLYISESASFLLYSLVCCIFKILLKFYWWELDAKELGKVVAGWAAASHQHFCLQRDYKSAVARYPSLPHQVPQNQNWMFLKTLKPPK